MNRLHQFLREEIARAHAEGVTCRENMPFWLPGSRPECCVLLVHGFTASPWEMSHVGRYLNDRGFACLGIRLPGHGSSPEQLRRTKRHHWLEVVRKAAAILAENYRIAGVGSSTGALLLVRACLEGISFEKLALCSPFLRIRHKLAPLAGLLKYLRPYQHNPHPPAIAPFFYDRRPLSGVAEIQRLATEIKPHLGDLTRPCLVLAASGDETIDPTSAELLYRLIGSRDKQFHMYNRDVPHVLVMPGHPQFDDVLRRIARFLED